MTPSSHEPNDNNSMRVVAVPNIRFVNNLTNIGEYKTVPESESVDSVTFAHERSNVCQIMTKCSENVSIPSTSVGQ